MTPKEIRQHIMDFLGKHRTSTVKQVADALKDVAKYDTISYHIRRMARKGDVLLVKYGHYALTASPEQELQRQPKQRRENALKSVVSSPESSADFENLLEIVTSFKKKYGRARLFNMLEKIKNLIGD